MSTAQAQAAAALAAMRTYEWECRIQAQMVSMEEYGHPGAFIAEHHPTDEGRLRAMSKALEELEKN